LSHQGFTPLLQKQARPELNPVLRQTEMAHFAGKGTASGEETKGTVSERVPSNGGRPSLSEALTLQQLDTILCSAMIYVSSMTIEPAVANIIPCETGLVVVSEKIVTTTGLVLPSQNARAAAAKLPRRTFGNPRKWRTHFERPDSPVHHFFKDRAVRGGGDCAVPRRAAGGAAAHDPAFGPRTRSVFVYEWAAKEFEIDATAISLEDLANTTHGLYFNPRPKAAP
jgi:hypothetical protein